MAKLLLADENFSFPAVERLRIRGHDVVTLTDLGRQGEGLTDPQVLALAVTQGRAVLTFNRRDFIRLHRQNDRHKGFPIKIHAARLPSLGVNTPCPPLGKRGDDPTGLSA